MNIIIHAEKNKIENKKLWEDKRQTKVGYPWKMGQAPQAKSLAEGEATILRGANS